MMLCRQGLLTRGRDHTLIPKARLLRSKCFHHNTASSSGVAVRCQTPFGGLSTEPLENTHIPTHSQTMPEVLWIGCSDSSPQEFVVNNISKQQSVELRNMGNMIIHGDLSSEIMIKHAVVDLQVKHIVVCGHYGCGIVKAASREGLKGPWLKNLNSLHSNHQEDINRLPVSERDRFLVKLNVLEQLRVLRTFPEVSGAITSGNLRIHGAVYDAERDRSYRLVE